MNGYIKSAFYSARHTILNKKKLISSQTFPSPLGAFKSLDKDGTGQIQVNIQEVRNSHPGMWVPSRGHLPSALNWAPSLLFSQKPLGRAEKGSWYSHFPSSSLSVPFSPQWLQLTMYS